MERLQKEDTWLSKHQFNNLAIYYRTTNIQDNNTRKRPTHEHPLFRIKFVSTKLQDWSGYTYTFNLLHILLIFISPKRLSSILKSSHLINNYQ